MKVKYCILLGIKLGYLGGVFLYSQDKRFRDTEEKIIKSFWSLMFEKDINTITVTEITKQAAISRSDFYNHYLDKYELLQKQANQYIEEIKIRYRRRFAEMDIREFLSELTDYIIEEKEKLNILIVLPKETHVNFVEQCEFLLRETFILNNRKQKLKNHVPIEYTAKLFASIAMTYILHTVEQPYKNQRIINAINEIQILLFDD